MDQGSARQAGQGIVLRHMAQLVLRFLALSHFDMGAE